MTISEKTTQGYALAAMIEETPDAVFIKDAAGRYLLVNAAGAELIGKQPEDITGKHDRELFPPDTAESITAADRRVLTSGKSEVLEQPLTVANGCFIFE